MDFESIYSYTSRIQDTLIAYKKFNAIDIEPFYRALDLIVLIQEKSFISLEHRKVVEKWMKGGSTPELKEALNYVGYNEIDIIDFNAMAIIDSVREMKLNNSKTE